jgi:predicted amidophosphoribosyltransferase
MKESCPGSREIRSPYPEELFCVFCGKKNEIWTDEPDTVCKGCGKTITRDMKPSCLQWCSAAKECVGAEKYERLIKKLAKQNS